MEAVGYVRVSSDEQARHGVSLAAQREQIRAYCKARGWQLVEVFADEGLSAKDLARPGLQAALATVDSRAANVLVVTKLDRLSRRVRDILGLVEDRFSRNGASLVSIGENLDATTAMGRFTITLLAGLAQMEREQVAERTRAALSHLKATGRHLGAVPFGKALDAAGRLVPDPEAQKALRRARRMRARGASWVATAAAMGWSVSQTRTRLDARYREQTRAAFRRGGARKGR